ncbi:MAG TPA: YfhO family protein [Candidatus Dormibacteraeota bacterium]|nr:YfhO family protein [Candidatus Dormibacteraeota bacterium]
MRRSRDVLACALLILAAATFVAFWVYLPYGMPAFDIYMYYQPNMLYGAQRLAAGGSGLLWNPWQNCGQPSFGISSTGLLYPANLLYLLVGSDRALQMVELINFAIAGLGAYALCRQLGTGRVAALCGGVTFQLGGASIDLNTWGPQMGGAYVWTPAALACCEALLRRPRARLALALAATLALPLLTGFPQTVFFAYQVIALRVLWELLTRRAATPAVGVGLIGLGLLLAPLLVAVQLVPAIEMAARSVRGAALSMAELQPGVAPSLQRLARQVAARIDTFNPLVIVPAMAAGAWWCRRATVRVGLFYAVVALLYLALAMGEATPLFAIYRRLPLGALFREPARFVWVSNFCAAVLTGLGVDALGRHPPQRWRRLAAPVSVAVAALALARITSLLPIEMILGVAIVASAAAAAASARWLRAATVVSGVAVILGLLLFRPYFSPAAPAQKRNVFAPRAGWGLALRNMPLRRPIDGATLERHGPQLTALAARMTPQQRAYFAYAFGDFSFMPKTASLFDVAVPQDYEPQADRRYAAFWIMMRNGVELKSLNQFYFPSFGPQEFRRPLLDLAAGRYIVAEPSADDTARYGLPPLVPLADAPAGGLRVYENPTALPRAFYVPQAAVVADPAALLQRLAAGGEDRRALLLLDEPPPSGFLGAAPPAGAGPATVEFVVNEPEHVVLRAHAPARGFVHLADQHFPGWTATVNGAPAPILRANYLFRAVEVPAGEATIEFRYAPGSVRLGAAISGATLLALLAAAVGQRRRRAAGATA